MRDSFYFLLSTFYFLLSTFYFLLSLISRERPACRSRAVSHPRMPLFQLCSKQSLELWD